MRSAHRDGPVAEHRSRALRLLLVGGTAIFLADFGWTRWTMFGLVSSTRLTAALVVVLLLPVGAFLPALVALGAVTVVVAALNLVEVRIHEREGWRARTGTR